MVNRALRDAIKTAKDWASDRSVQRCIREFRQKHLVTSEQAERMVAYLLGIPLEDFEPPDTIAETRDLLNREGLPVVTVVHQSASPTKKVLKVRLNELDDALLPASVFEDARRMAEIYPYLYVFENSVRFFICQVMEAAHGNAWWNTRVGKPVRDEVQGRVRKEKQNPWHGRRSDHPIYYTNIGHLIKVVKSNEAAFAPFFRGLTGGTSWLEIRLGEIELSRNAVAHHRPLTRNNIATIKLYFDQWQDQLRAWAELLGA